MKKLIVLFGVVLLTGVGILIWRTSLEKESNSLKDIKEEIKQKDLPKELLRKMTLKEKIGQMLFIEDRVSVHSDDFWENFKNYQPGGFILFRENATSYQDVRTQNEKMQQLSKIPLFIGTDQEGGVVQRFKNLKGQIFTSIPSMQTVGKTKDPKIAKTVGNIIGSELKTLGINLDFAPVLDINSNPKNPVIGSRSFGDNKEVVTTMALSFAKGLKEEKIIPVYKHFPGHGDTSEDSHNGFANIQKNKEELKENEFYPFQEAAKEKDAMIMVGHLSLPLFLKEQTPATLSKDILSILREEMNFDGVIITDALNMGALTKHYSEEEVLIQAVKAGNDILLIPKDFKKAVEILTHAVQTNTLTEERIDASVLRILRLKEAYQLFVSTKGEELKEEDWQAHQNFIQTYFH